MSERASVSQASPAAGSVPSGREQRIGVLLVFLSALMWSFGGTIARFIEAPDSWTVVFWRSFWAAAFLLGFMAWRDGLRGTLKLFRDMGLPGLLVALCFATASTSFVVALAYTTVANILLMQAGVPLLAALIAWVAVSRACRRSRPGRPLPRSSAASPSWSRNRSTGEVSPIGDGLALLIAVVFSHRNRHYPPLRPCAHDARDLPRHDLCRALCGEPGGGFAVSSADMGFLFAFGAINLGLGLACFATGARLIPAAVAALIGTFEPILGPDLGMADPRRDPVRHAPSWAVPWCSRPCSCISAWNSGASRGRAGRASPACLRPIDRTVAAGAG